jgi:hypothetical protein
LDKLLFSAESSAIFLRAILLNSEKELPKLLREGGNYALCFLLLLVCIAVGNFLASNFWDSSLPDYSTWRGVIRSIIETGIEIFVYSHVVGSFRRLEARHAAIPPLVLCVASVTIAGIALYVSYSNQVATINGWQRASQFFGLLGWAGYGFWRLTDGDDVSVIRS